MSDLRNKATAHTEIGTYTFQKSGTFLNQVDIQKTEDNEIIATGKFHSGILTLTFANQMTFSWQKTGLLTAEHFWIDPEGQKLVVITPKSWGSDIKVLINPAIAQLIELPFLVTLGAFLIAAERGYFTAVVATGII